MNMKHNTRHDEVTVLTISYTHLKLSHMYIIVWHAFTKSGISMSAIQVRQDRTQPTWTSAGTSHRSFSLRLGRIMRVMPAWWAASTFSLMPPTYSKHHSLTACVHTYTHEPTMLTMPPTNFIQQSHVQLSYMHKLCNTHSQEQESESEAQVDERQSSRDGCLKIRSLEVTLGRLERRLEGSAWQDLYCIVLW